MALTFSSITRTKLQRRYFNFATITWDATYPAGGESVTAADFGLSRLDYLVALDAAGFQCQYIASTGKIKCFYYDYNAVGDGLAIEIAVGDTAILSGIVTTFLAIGV